MNKLLSLIETPIGKGGFGVVHKGLLHSNKRHVAIKTIENNYRAHREIEILQAIQMPCIVQIPRLYHVVEEVENCHLVMEYIKGGNLIQYAGKKLPEPVVKGIARDVLKCLSVCHEKNIMYGDMKLANIVATQPILDMKTLGESLVKVVDYGSAHYCQDEPFTRQFGTPMYMAPEIFMRHFEKPADIWALGICLYILLTGRYPYPVNVGKVTYDELAHVILHEEITKDSAIPKNAWTFIKSLLCEFPHERPTALEALNDTWLTN